jgi:hypothetical protein
MANHYTQEHLVFLAWGYQLWTRAELTAKFNQVFGLDRSQNSVVACLKNHGITSGRTGCFTPGQTSWNAGKKGYMTGNKTSFKKGQMPHTHVPVGTERKDTAGVWKVKIGEPNKWQYLHRQKWIAANGPIPHGHMIRFADGNYDNLDLSNLILISRADHGTINRHIGTDIPAELLPAAITTAQLKRRIRQLEATCPQPHA